MCESKENPFPHLGQVAFTETDGMLVTGAVRLNAQNGQVIWMDS